MTKKTFRNITIVCVAAFLMAAISVILCANYLLTYKPTTDNSQNTFIVTDEFGNQQVISANELAGSYNFLVLGHDRAALLTDVMMIVNYNLNTSSVTVLQLPRDTYVSKDIPTHKLNALFSTYYYDEINNGKKHSEARIGAVTRMADTLESALGISIYKSAIMDLNGFINIVDALGGVEVDVPYDLYYVDTAQNLYINIKAGYQTLSGKQAEQFVRYREGYRQADIGRENAQKIFMSAFLQKAKSSISISNVSTLTTLMNEVISNLTTDITVSDMVYFAKGLISNVDLSNVKMMTVPGSVLSHEYGGSYYVYNRSSLVDIVSSDFMTSDIDKDIFAQSFDKELLFTDRYSNRLTTAYYSNNKPEIDESFNAQDVLNDSINIPIY